MKKNDRDKDITIISWIRHKLSHPNPKGPEPFSISNPEHVEQVQEYLLAIQELARQMIRENEKV